MKAMLLGILPLSNSAATATDFYISPAGSDAGAGTAAQLWATLTRARDAVRGRERGTGSLLVA